VARLRGAPAESPGRGRLGQPTPASAHYRLRRGEGHVRPHLQRCLDSGPVHRVVVLAAQQGIIVSASNHTRRRAPQNPGTRAEGWAILRGMPDKSARYHSLTVARYRDWVQQLTLKQYILFLGVINFAVATVVDAATSAVTGPFSWPGVAVWTVLMTAIFTWWRQGTLPQHKEYPADQGDDSTRS
jgi:hypothetical protein